MNERIQQFAKQSGLVIRYGKSIDMSTGKETLDAYFNLAPKMSELEKFAELIVGKCLEQIKYMLKDEDEQLFAHDETTDCVNESLMDAHHNIALEFGFGKQFGVEE